MMMIYNSSSWCGSISSSTCKPSFKSLSLEIHVSCTYTLCLSCFLFLSFMQSIDHTFCFFLLLSPKTAVLGENVRFLSCFLFLSFMRSIDHTFCFFLLLHPKLLCLVKMLGFFLAFFFFFSCGALITHIASFSCYHPKMLCLVKMLGYKLYLWDHTHLSSHFPQDQGSIEQEPCLDSQKQKKRGEKSIVKNLGLCTTNYAVRPVAAGMDGTNSTNQRRVTTACLFVFVLCNCELNFFHLCVILLQAAATTCYVATNAGLKQVK